MTAAPEFRSATPPGEGGDATLLGGLPFFWAAQGSAGEAIKPLIRSARI